MTVTPSEQSDTDSTKGTPEDNAAPSRGEASSPHDKPTCPEDKKPRKEWWHTNDLPMLIVTFLGVVAVVAYTCVTRQQLAVMRGQLDEMQVEQRPWIYVTIEITSGLTFYENNGSAVINSKWTFKNPGKTPGRHVFARYATLSPGKLDFNFVRERQKTLCDDKGDAGQEPFTVFPDDPVVQPRKIFPDALDLRKDYPSAGLKGARPFFIFGCVEYQFATGKGDYHHSPFIYRLGPPEPPPVITNFPYIELHRSVDKPAVWIADPAKLLFAPDYRGTVDIN